MLRTIEFFNAHLHETKTVVENKLSTIQQACLLIRDIPYSCSKYHDKPKTFAELISNFLKEGRGTCSSKHFTLGMFCESMGIKTNYVTYEFYWQEQSIEFPSELKLLKKDMPYQIHTALILNTTDLQEPRLIDATWDKPLATFGFPVNIFDSIFEQNKLGVTPSKEIFVFNSAFETWEYLQEIKQTIPFSNIVPQFYNKLDTWMKQVRTNYFLDATKK